MLSSDYGRFFGFKQTPYFSNLMIEKKTINTEQSVIILILLSMKMF